jgi:hypothetical protein
MSAADIEHRRARIVSIASQIVAGRIASGEIPCTDEAVRAAREAFDAAWEYVS